jgi:small-conductance mechanosensitive channel
MDMLASPWWGALLLLTALALGLAAHSLCYTLLRRSAAQSSPDAAQGVQDRLFGPTRAVLMLTGLALGAGLYGPHLPPALNRSLADLLGVAWTLALAWLAMRGVLFLEDRFLAGYDLGAKDNLQARRIHTQVRVLNRILGAAAFVLTLAAVLMRFEGFRQLGAGVLASAGLAGVVLGLAAQKTLAVAVAGVQLALTQPIRLDDVVVVEGEWGRVEEISLTQVVVRIWDQRRLILPSTYFLERPFQNWTRVSAEVWGTVLLHADYTLPAQAMREELTRYVAAHPKWDGQACSLQVTGAAPGAVELRAVVSAADSGQLWDLRCDVREPLLAWLREEPPRSLPRLRAEAAAPDWEAARGALGRENPRGPAPIAGP